MKKSLISVVTALLFFMPVSFAAELFPVIDGWEISVEERVYNASDLWEIINGAAEGFINYGFADLHMAEYSRGDMIVRVELYDQGSPENAYGMYSSERMPDYPLADIGAQGYKSDGIVNFFTGPYYVKIMTVGLTEVSEDQIMAIAGRVDGQLGFPDEMPDVLGLFPSEGMEALSDTYATSSFMGYGFLHSAYTARYNSGGEAFQLFIIKSTAEEVSGMVDKYTAFLKEDKVQDKGTYKIFNDTYNGKVFISVRDGYMIGVLDTDNEQVAVGYINAVLQEL